MEQQPNIELAVKPKDDVSQQLIMTGFQYCKSLNQAQAIGRTNRPLTTAINIIYMTTFGKFP